MDPFFTSWVYHSLAQLSYERNELAEARRYLSQARDLRTKPEEIVHVFTSGALIQARLLHASGEAAQALALLLAPLSEQEQRVLRLLAAGRSNPEIANILVISLNTVKTHIQSLYRKLDVHNRMEASLVRRHSAAGLHLRHEGLSQARVIKRPFSSQTDRARV